MWAKLWALISSKAALAALGGVLVVGGGATVVATGHVPPQVPLPGRAHAHPTPHPDNDNDHGHVAIQGTLTGYNTAATPHTIQVAGKAEDNDPARGTPAAGGSNGKATPTGSAHVPSGSTGPACTLTSPFTIRVDSSTDLDGDVKGVTGRTGAGHSPPTPGTKPTPPAKPTDPLPAALAAHARVEVQATEDSQCVLTAAKVTISAQPRQAFVGTVATVGTARFTLQRAHGSILTVNIFAATTFDGAAHSLASLKQGMRVMVVGIQPDGPDGTTVDASRVNTAGPGSAPNPADQGRWAEVEGTIARMGGASFVVQVDPSVSITVKVSGATSYVGDARGFDQLAAGMRVAAEGPLQADGSVQATRVASADPAGQV